nr:PREDICTED: spermatogenesis-associated protein 5 [Bemisia tabaci]XP_018896183.1 PREDICTED: spermatogenesis-associated protein 5 [Bemisia tabaci]
MKRRKSGEGTWCLCENCGSILFYTNLELHQKEFCPPSAELWKHPFILDSVIYSSLDTLDDDAYNYVHISEAMIRLNKLVIGEAVLLIQNKQVVIKLVRQSLVPQNQNFKIFIAEEELKNISFERGPVKVKKIDRLPPPAKEIVFSIADGDVNHEKIMEYLAQNYRNHYFKIGSKLSFTFYGTKLTAIVDSAVKHFDGNDVAVNFSYLSLEDDSVASGNFVQSCESTKWTLSGSSSPTEKTGEKEVFMLSKVGGLRNVISQLQDMIKLCLSSKDVGIRKPASGILLFGIHGTGKTMLMKSLAYSFNVNVVEVQSSEVFSKYFGESETRIKSYFEEASSNEPSIILIDEVNILCPSHKGTDQQRRICASLISALDSVRSSKTRLVVLGTCTQPQLIDPALRRPGRFDFEIELPVPKVEERHEILKQLLSSINNNVGDSEIESLAKIAHGFVGADLGAVINHAGTRAMLEHTSSSSAPVVTINHLQCALSSVNPTAMREVLVEVPHVLWSDIGGQHEIKLKLRQAVEWPLTHPESFVRLGIRPPAGVLLYGPPGCSKTMIAKALATESKLNFISVKGSELLNKYVGESEKAVSTVFYRARQVTPSIIFFDELDALAGERGDATSDGGTNVQERVLAQLLVELDGVSPLKSVTVVAATNRPDRIDKALLRPGRLDRLIYIPLPDAETRKEILTIKFRKTPVCSDVDLEWLVTATAGYSGAELVGVCHEAALKALEEDLETMAISRSHFDYALTVVTPRTPTTLLNFYQNFKP